MLRCGAPQGSRKGMDSVTYIRRQPWRPRSPWLSARVGGRRRGFRQDELAPAPDAFQDGVDVVLAAVDEAPPLDDMVLAETVVEAAVHHAVPARVDVSGLLAIAAVAPKRFTPPHEEGAFPPVGWHAYGDRNDEELRLSRHSA